MFDVTGRQVYSSEIYVSKGTNVEFINVAELRTGTYMIKAVSNGNQTVTKLAIF